jgi:hypothetical protein
VNLEACKKEGPNRHRPSPTAKYWPDFSCRKRGGQSVEMKGIKSGDGMNQIDGIAENTEAKLEWENVMLNEIVDLKW